MRSISLRLDIFPMYTRDKKKYLTQVRHLTLVTCFISYKQPLRNHKKNKLALKTKCFSVWRQKQSSSHGVKNGCKNLQSFSFKPFTKNNIVWKLACGNFMLLQDFFAKATLLRVHKKFSTEVCSTVFLPPEIK